MILGQRIRLDPNNVQRSFFAQCAGTARFTFNWGLARWSAQYKSGEKPNWQRLNKELNSIKASEFPWMADLPWATPNKALADLGAAFTSFFRRVEQGEHPGFPRLKKKSRCREGFAVEGRALQFDGRKVKIPKLGWVRTRQELRFPGKVLSARFNKRADHWYLSVQVDVANSWGYPHRCKSQEAVGVDLGVVDLAVLSTGERVKAPRVLRGHEAHQRRLNKELSRRTKGGKNWAKTKVKLAKLHEQVANLRKDVTHKLTAHLVRDFEYIGVEDLNVEGMKQGLRLGKSVSDAAMAEVIRQLEYKLTLAGSVIVKADRWFPSTKTCADCGHIIKKLTLSVRKWSCPACRMTHDRDVNAAINLREMALAQRVATQCQGSSGPVLGDEAKLPSGWESGICVVRQEHHGFSP